MPPGSDGPVSSGSYGLEICEMVLMFGSTDKMFRSLKSQAEYGYRRDGLTGYALDFWPGPCTFREQCHKRIHAFSRERLQTSEAEYQPTLTRTMLP